MKVKPTVPGSMVRFPVPPYRALLPEGEDVPDGDVYWTRRVLDGDVTRVDAPTGREPIAPLTTR